MRDYLDANRDQLWAEGMALYLGGVPARLPDAAKEVQASFADRFRDRDTALEDSLRRYLEANANKRLKLEEIAWGVGLLKSDEAVSRLRWTDTNRLSNGLQQLGWQIRKCRRDGHFGNYWELG